MTVGSGKCTHTEPSEEQSENSACGPMLADEMAINSYLIAGGQPYVGGSNKATGGGSCSSTHLNDISK